MVTWHVNVRKEVRKRQNNQEMRKKLTHRARKAESKWSSECSSDETAGLIEQHALSSFSQKYE